jgi:hypothetical protein
MGQIVVQKNEYLMKNKTEYNLDFMKLHSNGEKLEQTHEITGCLVH